MNPQAIIAAIGAAISVATEAVALGASVEPYAAALWNRIVNKKVVVQSDIDGLNADLAALSDRLQAPLPPEQDDDV